MNIRMISQCAFLLTLVLAGGVSAGTAQSTASNALTIDDKTPAVDPETGYLNAEKGPNILITGR